MRRSLAETGCLAIIVVLAAFGLAGCGDDDDGPTAPGNGAPQDTFPPATSPTGAVARWLDTYEAQSSAAYGHSLTSDFRYVFSSQSDPDLVAEYGNTWGPELESAAAQHLFGGFTDQHGIAQPGAASIEVIPPTLVSQDDPDHPDSTRHYAVVAMPSLELSITLENEAGFEVNAPFTVYLVRGDAAVLGTEQDADSTVWYVRRVDDLTPPISLSPEPGPVFNPASQGTWGRIRSQYAERRLVVQQ